MGKKMYAVWRVIMTSSKPSISTHEILEILEKEGIHMDIKTVRSCIRRINAFCFELMGKEMMTLTQKSGVRIDNEFFTDGELQFLIDSIMFHQDLKDEDKNTLKEKLLKFSSFHQQNRLIHFQPTKKELTFSLLVNLSTLMKAIDHQYMIAFEYMNYDIKDGELHEIPSNKGNHNTQYQVSPYQIVMQNNHYYLIGYNEIHKNQLTTYRIDRMRMITLISQPFIEMREQFDMVDEIEKMTNMYVSHQRATLEIECDKKLLREVVSRFGSNIKAKKLYQDHYLIIIEDIPISEGLVGWIMMLQNQIKVISPYFLKQEIHLRLKKMLALYEDEE